MPLPLGALEVRHPLRKRGISAMLVRCHMKAGKNECEIPSAMLSREGSARHEGYLELGW